MAKASDVRPPAPGLGGSYKRDKAGKPVLVQRTEAAPDAPAAPPPPASPTITPAKEA